MNFDLFEGRSKGDYLYAYVDLLGRDSKPRSYEMKERGKTL